MLSLLLSLSMSAHVHKHRRVKIVPNDYKYGIVTCDVLNVREDPNDDIIGVVVQGDILKIIDASGVWYQIEYKNYKKAFVYSQYVKIISDLKRREEVVDYATSLIGCGYVYGATGPTTFDKPGLVFYTYAKLGYGIPSTINGMYNSILAETVPSKCEIPADVVFFSSSSASTIPTMVGIYIGDRKFIWTDIDKGVCVKELDDLQKYYIGARRFI